MPNIVVLVTNVTVNNGVKVAFQATTETQVQVFGDVDLDFGLSVTLVNQAIEAAAKAALQAQANVTVQPLDKVLTFGGRVS